MSRMRDHILTFVMLLLLIFFFVLHGFLFIGIWVLLSPVGFWQVLATLVVDLVITAVLTVFSWAVAGAIWEN